MPEIDLIRGDRNFPLIFQIGDADGIPVNLIFYGLADVYLEVQNYAKKDDLFSITGSIPLDPCEVDGQEVGSGSLGWVVFWFTDETVDRSGEYAAEVKIDWPTGKILTCMHAGHLIRIKKDLPK